MKLEKKITPSETLYLLMEEFKRANGKFPLFNSKHEGYAVMKKEFDEFWDEIKKKNYNDTQIKKECIQVGAMVIKFLTSPIFDEK